MTDAIANLAALPAPRLLSCRIPFQGFYESLWSQSVDNHIEQEIEYFSGQCGTPLSETIGDYAPELVRIAPDLPEGALAEALSEAFWTTDYSAAYQHLAKEYSAEFIDWLNETLDGEVFGAFEEVTSPQYYNFETDRLFAGVSESALREMREKLDAEAPELLAETFREHLTSRSGFCSFYDNTVPGKDLAEWDHNELYMLLLAWVSHQDLDNSIDFELYDRSIGGLYEEVYRAVDLAVDWEGKFKASLVNSAEELAEEHGITSEDLPEPRCTETLELPLGDQ